MTQVSVVCVGKLKESCWREAVQEYSKRLSAYCRLELDELAEERLPESPTGAQIEAALDAEAARILPRLEGKTVVALCVEGRGLTSEELAARMGREIDAGHKLAFVIGSSHGLSERVKSRADIRLSFSAMTFPHQLFRVMLLEQIYRGFTILNGKTYHK